MILHLIESSRPRPWYAGPTIWSAGAHAAIVAALAVGSPGPGVDGAGESPTEVIYFLPLLPAPTERPQDERLEYRGDAGGGADVEPERGDGFAVVPVGRTRESTGTEAAPPPVAASSDSGEAATSPVYLEAELDVPVERDPASAGPAYPDELRLKNVEGEVVAEWVVDTTGRADSASFHVLESTHPLFSRAVREVLPGMNFRPAELMGRRVRQLVRQQFRFVLERPVRDTSIAAPDAARGKAGPPRRPGDR